MPDDLINRLRAALDTAEREARAATPGPWWAGDEEPNGQFYGFYGEFGWVVDSNQGLADARHIAAWDPSRVLRLIQRDRDVIARHRRFIEGAQHPEAWPCEECAHSWPCPDLLAVAAFWLNDTEEAR